MLRTDAYIHNAVRKVHGVKKVSLEKYKLTVLENSGKGTRYTPLLTREQRIAKEKEEARLAAIDAENKRLEELELKRAYDREYKRKQKERERAERLKTKGFDPLIDDIF